MGVGAPNICRDGSKTMCSILLSDELGFIRIYPIPGNVKWPLWSRVEIEIERSKTDSRAESYKLLSWKILGPGPATAEDKRRVLNECVLKSGTLDPINYMNEQRASIALIRLEWEGIEVSLNRRNPGVADGDEEFLWVKAQAEHWNKPYIRWASQQGASHTTHLVGREIYEGLRHNPTMPWNIFNNVQINNPDYEHWLLLGNMKDKRNVWVGVHLHRLKKSTVGSIPTFFTIRDGKPEGWPYCRQEWANVPVVDNQPLLFTTDIMTSTNNRGNTLTAA